MNKSLVANVKSGKHFTTLLTVQMYKYLRYVDHEMLCVNSFLELFSCLFQKVAIVKSVWVRKNVENNVLK